MDFASSFRAIAGSFAWARRDLAYFVGMAIALAKANAVGAELDWLLGRPKTPCRMVLCGLVSGFIPFRRV